MTKVKTRECSSRTYKRNDGKDGVYDVTGYDVVVNFCNLRIQQKCTAHKVSYPMRPTVMTLKARIRPISKISSAGYTQPNQPYIPTYRHQCIIKSGGSYVTLYSSRDGGVLI